MLPMTMAWLAIEIPTPRPDPTQNVSAMERAMIFGRATSFRPTEDYRAFMEPRVGRWPERGCIGCSMVADQVAHPAHLGARETSLAFVSRGSQDDLQRLQAKMGWEPIPWYALTDDLDADLGVHERHGTNAFIRNGNRVFRTGFINGRGDIVDTGTMKISSAALTALDLLRYPRASGGIDNVATVLLAHRDQVYRDAKARHPQRWSGDIRNWKPVGDVHLNPAKDSTKINMRKAA